VLWFTRIIGILELGRLQSNNHGGHTMNRMNRILSVTTLAVLCIGIAISATGAMAQGKSKVDKAKLVGAWTLVSIDNTMPDGKTIRSFDQNDGVVIFEANGRFVQFLARSDLPKFASNNRNTGSPDENKAIIQGSLAYSGTYTVNAKDGTVTLRIERSTFPNWNGTDQKRTITALTANELKWHNPAATVGGTTETDWKRNK
jgi:Lipocalin-like domain